jgi:VIT1/CCC1 family predicted Fe2+/Mn2+ transporter
VSIGAILLVVLVLMLLGIMPTWPHSKSWGYGPSGGVGVVLVVVLALFLLGRI